MILNKYTEKLSMWNMLIVGSEDIHFTLLYFKYTVLHYYGILYFHIYLYILFDFLF